MQILIDLFYLVNECKSLQSGYFRVQAKEFCLSPDEEAAKVAFEWYRDVKRGSSYKLQLLKVTYNQKDLTELVMIKEQNFWTNYVFGNELPF